MHNLDEALSRSQDFLRKKPILLIGTGLSVSMGLPGMDELTEYLRAELPKRCKTKQMVDEWTNCMTRIDKCGLEDGLGKEDVNEELLANIVEVTAELIEIRDSEFREKLFTDSKTGFPIANLIKHIIDSLPVDNPTLDIEYACDYAGIHCCTGFSGAYVQQFSQDSLTTHLHTLARVPTTRGKLKNEYRRRKQVRLLKPHGSLKWQQLEDKIYQCMEPLAAATRVIITPGLTKYRASLTDPVMNCHREIANSSLRDSNAVLVIGYGFNDSHLQTVLKERLSQGMECLILTKKLSGAAKDIIKDYANVIVFEESMTGETSWFTHSLTGYLPDKLWDLTRFVKLVIG